MPLKPPSGGDQDTHQRSGPEPRLWRGLVPFSLALLLTSNTVSSCAYKSGRIILVELSHSTTVRIKRNNTERVQNSSWHIHVVNANAQ